MIDLRHGDCYEMLSSLEDKSVDLLLTDPPYAVLKRFHGNWDEQLDYERFWSEVKRVCKDSATKIVFGIEPFSTHVRYSNLKEFKFDYVWKKTTATGHLLAKFQPMRNHEMISVFYGKGNTFNPQKTTGHPRVYKKCMKLEEQNNKKVGAYGLRDRVEYDSTERYVKSVLEYSKDKKNYHYSQKPVELLKYLLKAHSNVGDVVLDCFMGSGSTGVACVATGRSFIGIERDDNWYQCAVDRIENAVPEFDYKEMNNV